MCLCQRTDAEKLEHGCVVFCTPRRERRCSSGGRKTLVPLAETQLAHHPIDQSQLVPCPVWDDEALLGHKCEFGQEVFARGRPPLFLVRARPASVPTNKQNCVLDVPL